MWDAIKHDISQWGLLQYIVAALGVGALAEWFIRCYRK